MSRNGRVHLYCRVSSAGQVDNTSLATQEAACRAWCAERNLAVVSVASDALTLVAITAVLFITSPFVTIFAIVLFGGLVFGVQQLLRRRQYRLGEEMAEAGLEAWQFLLPGLDGFREARLTRVPGCSSTASSARGCAAPPPRE